MSKVHAKGSIVHNTSVDAGSYILDLWVAGGQLSPPLSLFNVQAALGTSANMYVTWSTGSAGTGAFATNMILNGGSALATSIMTTMTHLAEASIFVNYSLSATSTMKLFQIAEQIDW